MYLLQNFQSKEMYFDVSPPTPCAVSIPIQPGSARFIFFLFSSPLSHGRFPIRARLHVKISARSVYFRRKTRVARGACLRACARGTGRGEKVQAISRATHGQPLCFSLSLSVRWLQQVEEGKRPLLHHPSSPSSSVERTYPIQTAAHSCASRAR